MSGTEGEKYMHSQVKFLETKLNDALTELRLTKTQSEKLKDENAQLRSDLRKCKDVLVELGIGVKKLSTDTKKGKIKVGISLK